MLRTMPRDCWNSTVLPYSVVFGIKTNSDTGTSPCRWTSHRVIERGISDIQILHPGVGEECQLSMTRRNELRQSCQRAGIAAEGHRHIPQRVRCTVARVWKCMISMVGIAVHHVGVVCNGNVVWLGEQSLVPTATAPFSAPSVPKNTT